MLLVLITMRLLCYQINAEVRTTQMRATLRILYVFLDIVCTQASRDEERAKRTAM